MVWECHKCGHNESSKQSALAQNYYFGADILSLIINVLFLRFVALHLHNVLTLNKQVLCFCYQNLNIKVVCRKENQVVLIFRRTKKQGHQILY